MSDGPTEEEIKASFESADSGDKPKSEAEIKEAFDAAEEKPTEDKPTEDKPTEAPTPGTVLDGKSNPTARYQVVGEENEVDWEQSFEKISDAYTNLSSKLGTRNRPETIDDYGADEEAVKRFLTKSLDLDFSIDQVKGIREFIAAEQATQTQEAPYKDADDVTSSLRKEWGNDYGKNLQNAQTAATELDLDMTDPNVGNNRALIELLSRLGPKFSEDGTITGASATTSVTEEEFNKLTETVEIKGVELTIADAGHPYWLPENQKKANEYYASKG